MDASAQDRVREVILDAYAQHAEREAEYADNAQFDAGVRAVLG
jgi:hypothetical protein